MIDENWFNEKLSPENYEITHHEKREFLYKVDFPNIFAVVGYRFKFNENK